MSTAITTEAPAAKASALVVLASRLNVEPDKLHQALKATVCPKSTNEELMAFCIVCNEYGLNPFIKEIYAFPGKSGGIVPMVSIDGWIRIINDHPMLDGIQFSFDTTTGGELIACTCRIHRKDRSHPIEVTEFLSECKRNTEPWKMESRMLRHKALIQCARVAFGFSGIHDEDEAKDIAEGPRNVTPPSENPFRPAAPATVDAVEVEEAAPASEATEHQDFTWEGDK